MKITHGIKIQYGQDKKQKQEGTMHCLIFKSREVMTHGIKKIYLYNSIDTERNALLQSRNVLMMTDQIYSHLITFC